MATKFEIKHELESDMNISDVFKGIDACNGQPLVNPMCPNTSPLPLDVKGIIFQNVMAELPNLALVCKNWQAMVDDKPFRETIRPAEAFGSREWKEYIGDAGEESLLPRRAYGDMEKGNYMLTFIPEIVKVTQSDRTIEDVVLDNLQTIGKLVANPIKGNKVGYDPDSWQAAIEEKRTLEKPHWVLLSKELIGRNKSYADQQKLAGEENKNMPGANISGLIDTTISVFMEYVRSGERNFIWDPAKNEYNFVRVNEQTGGCRLGLGFAPAGLFVLHSDDDADDCVGFALARRSLDI